MALEEDNRNGGHVLRQSGYTTGYAGKYHVGPSIKREDEYAKFALKYVPRDAPDSEAASAAAYEMEINLIGTGFGLLGYLHDHDPLHLE